MSRLAKSDAQLNATAEARHAQEKLAKDGKLGWGITLPWRKAKKGKGKRRGGKRSAAPPAVAVTTSNDPTIERVAKEPFGIDKQTHAGGQVSHWVRTAVEDYSKHFTSQEIGDGKRLVDDAEFTTRYNLICARTYTGMPYMGADADATGHIPDDQRIAHARFNWVMRSMDEKFGSAVAYLVMGVRRERMGAPMSAHEFAAMSSRYSDKATKGAFTAGFLKATLIRVGEAYRAWDAEVKRREQAVILAGGPLAAETQKRLDARRERWERRLANEERVSA